MSVALIFLLEKNLHGLLSLDEFFFGEMSSSLGIFFCDKNLHAFLASRCVFLGFQGFVGDVERRNREGYIASINNYNTTLT